HFELVGLLHQLDRHANSADGIPNEVSGKLFNIAGKSLVHLARVSHRSDRFYRALGRTPEHGLSELLPAEPHGEISIDTQGRNRVARNISNEHRGGAHTAAVWQSGFVRFFGFK